MKNLDLKKLAILGISSGILAVVDLEGFESLNNRINSQYLAANTNNKSNNQQNNDIAQGYSNQGYFYNQDQGRSNNYYFQQNSKRNRNRSNRNDYNDDSDQDPYNNRSQSQRYNDTEPGNRYYREKIADNSEVSTPETPPNNDEKSNTEGKFLSKLSPQGQSNYQKLNTHEKIIAMNMAAHDCAGLNECKGQNACRTAQNACVGKGNCKGYSSCKLTPDEAVRLTSMLDKRNKL